MPIWQQLQEKIAALEAQRTTQHTSPVGGQLCRSARYVRSHSKAKLKDLAENLLSHFSALEEERAAPWMSRYGTEVEEASPQRESKAKEQGTGRSAAKKL